MGKLKRQQKQNTANVPIYRAKFYASIFGNIDRARDKMIKGAFSETIKDAEIPFIYGHDYNRPIIAKTTLSEDDTGLLVTAEFPYINDGKKFVDDALNKVAKTFSFGFDYEDIEYIGKDAGNDYFEIRKVKLYEVSTAAVPCNTEAKLVLIEKIS